MKTIELPVVYGYGPSDGGVRIEIPEGITRSQLRRAALHGPQNQSDVGIIPYRLLLPARAGGYIVWGLVHFA